MSLQQALAQGWCPRTTDETMPAVTGLLPPGPVWEGAETEGTVQHSYWRAYAAVLAYAYGRTCDYIDEFFCATVNESRDQWNAEYGLPDACDPYANNLCLKVAAHGGATCSDFVETAQLSGWVLSCEDLSRTIPEPIAGCFEVGCTSLGPTPSYVGGGSNLGVGQRGACGFGEVVAHPQPDTWENGYHDAAICPVPGSNLGQGPDTDESCCFIVGYYTMPDTSVPEVADYCQSPSDTIYFDCPRTDIPADTSPCPGASTELRGTDDNGNYSEWGHAYVWKVTVDLAASQSAQLADLPAPDPVDPQPISAAGNFMVGLPLFTTDGSAAGGAELCSDSALSAAPTFPLCFLDRIKPAHTTLLVEVQ